MLKVNSIMAQLLSNSFPALAAAISSSVAVNPNLDSISGGVLGGGGGGVDATLVHLHWLVIVGVMSFVSSVLQLIPLDNSAGSKLTGVRIVNTTSIDHSPPNFCDIGNLPTFL